MNYPPFFDEIPSITLQDDLSNFLGTFQDGIITFSYQDVAKIAGHSCPTVLGAYMMIQKALEALYNDTLPKRGELKIEFSHPQNEGVTGVMANIATVITGATSNFGFKGLNSRFNRCNLLEFNADISSLMRVTRVDTAQSVELSYDTSKLIKPPQMMDLMQRSLKGIATQDELNSFKTMWQNGVKHIFENSDNYITLKM